MLATNPNEKKNGRGVSGGVCGLGEWRVGGRLVVSEFI